MWVDAQRDGRPAEYRWCPLRKFRNSIPRCKIWLTPLLEYRAVTLPIQDNARLGCKVNFAPVTPWRNFFRQGVRAPKMYIYCTSPGDGQTSCKV